MPAAVWHFSKLEEHWNRKHALAAFVPYISEGRYGDTFLYGPLIQTGQGTDFGRFLHMLAAGRISYDPGLSLVCTDDP